jgi:nitric oxide reductase large subunit
VRAFAYAAFYGIYGPLFAVLVLVVATLMFGIGERTEALDLLLGLPALVSMGIGMFLFALVIGILPAATTGLVYWWLSGLPFVARLPSLARVVLMSLVGGSVCVLFGLSFGAVPSDIFSEEALRLFVIPGMVAASLCTFLVDRRTRRLSPNKSLERTRAG